MEISTAPQTGAIIRADGQFQRPAFIGANQVQRRTKMRIVSMASAEKSVEKIEVQKVAPCTTDTKR